jgi:hypothetical protein
MFLQDHAKTTLRLTQLQLQQICTMLKCPAGAKAKAALLDVIADAVLQVNPNVSVVSTGKYEAPTQLGAETTHRVRNEHTGVMEDKKVMQVLVRARAKTSAKTTDADEALAGRTFLLSGRTLPGRLLGVWVADPVGPHALDGHLFRPDDNAVDPADGVAVDLAALGDGANAATIRPVLGRRLLGDVEVLSYGQRNASWALARKFRITATTAKLLGAAMYGAETLADGADPVLLAPGAFIAVAQVRI